MTGPESVEAEQRHISACHYTVLERHVQYKAVCREVTHWSVTEVRQARLSCEFSWSPRCRLFVALEGCVTPKKECCGREKNRNQERPKVLVCSLLFFLSLSHTQPLYLNIHNVFTLRFYFLSATWPLKESNELTADSLWLRGAESSVGWHYRKQLHIDTKKITNLKKKTQTERKYYGALLSV